MPKNDPTLKIQLDRTNKTYTPGEEVTGVVTLQNFPSKGIDFILMELFGYGWTLTHVKPRGMKSALLGISTSSSSSGPKHDSNYIFKTKQKLSGAQTAYSNTQFPFSFKLNPSTPSPLLDSYQGVHIQVQFELYVDMKLSLTTPEPPISSSQKFYVNVNGAGLKGYGEESSSTAKMMQPVQFSITPESVEAVAGVGLDSLPRFNFQGKIASNNCDIDQPLQGYIKLKECEVDTKSIEVQLLRVESFISDQTKEPVKECTQIQNIELACGNVLPGFEIPVYFLFPRYFSCPTVTPELVPQYNFSVSLVSKQIEFEVNIIIILKTGYQITENFPIKLFRSPIGTGYEKKKKTIDETLF